MKEKLINSLIKTFKLDKGDSFKNFGIFEGTLSTIINFLIFLIKYFYSFSLNSISLRADAFHTLSDILTSIMVIIGFYLSSKKPDKKHPFGHGRVEKIISILMSILLIYVGYEFFVNSFRRFKDPIKIDINIYIIIILLFTIILKEFLTLISLELGKKINSSSLKLDAWHHRSDSIATLFIVIGFITFKYGLYVLDGFFGMGVSALIIYTGISILFESSSFLIGEEPSENIIKKIKEISYKFDFIEDVHHIHIHDYGNQIEITFHVKLKGEKTLNEVHQKISLVEREIEKEIKNSSVTIHAEPI